MKCLAIQRENVNRRHATVDVTTNVQNDVPLHGHRPRDGVSIRQSSQLQQSAVRQTRCQSDVSSVGQHRSPASGIQDAVVDRVEVRAVSWSEVRSGGINAGVSWRSNLITSRARCAGASSC